MALGEARLIDEIRACSTAVDDNIAHRNTLWELLSSAKDSAIPVVVEALQADEADTVMRHVTFARSAFIVSNDFPRLACCVSII